MLSFRNFQFDPQLVGYYNILNRFQDQLVNGVRYLDLRVLLDSDEEKFYLVHSFEGGEFWKEMEGVVEFVQQHPTEILILDMNHIY